LNSEIAEEERLEHNFAAVAGRLRREHAGSGYGCGAELPAGVRQAWEEIHPVLRTTAAQLMAVIELHRKVTLVALAVAAR
jgi:hypothetical protein